MENINAWNKLLCCYHTILQKLCWHHSRFSLFYRAVWELIQEKIILSLFTEYKYLFKVSFFNKFILDFKKEKISIWHFKIDKMIKKIWKKINAYCFLFAFNELFFLLCCYCLTPPGRVTLTLHKLSVILVNWIQSSNTTQDIEIGNKYFLWMNFRFIR